MSSLHLALSTLSGFAVSALSIPIIIRVAHSNEWYDERNHRKIHIVDTPRLGGVGILAGFVAAIAVSLVLVARGESASGGDTVARELLQLASDLWPLGAGMIIVHGLGLIDDFRNLRAAFKLVFQTVAALFVALGPLRIEIVTIPFVWVEVPLGPFSYFVTLVWVVAITNAVNFIDGVDGLAGGTAAIAALAFAIIALLLGQGTAALIAVGLIGSVVGFLVFNAPPARIFMGDSGAYVLGFVLAVLPLSIRDEAGRTMGMLPALTILAIPVLDMTTAVFRRMRRGQHPFSADREHIHHKLLDLGLESWNLLLVVYAVTAAMSTVAILWHVWPPNVGTGVTLVAWSLAAAATIAITRRQRQKHTDE